MNNDKLKFVVDSRSFDGSCVTTMSDGIHGDYHHETLEELRDREKNPYLIAVSGNTVRKMIRIHLQSLCAPFSEITEERYFDYMDVLPPIRHTRNFFFLGEPYHADIYRFCFRAGGRYFTGLRSVTTPRKELERQMDNHYRNITFKGDILKEKPMERDGIWESGTEQAEIFKKVAIGHYKIVVDEIPKGYVHPDVTDIEVKDTAKVQKFEVLVEPICIRITGYALSSAAEKKQTRTIRSGIYVHIRDLFEERSLELPEAYTRVPSGSYQVKTDRVPDGYVLPAQTKITVFKLVTFATGV